MSETSEPPTAPVAASEPVHQQPVARTEPAVVATADRKSNRVLQAAAWVGIVAGTVFIIAVIFFSGFVLGKHSDGGGKFGGGSSRHHDMMFDREGPPTMPMMPRSGPGFGPGGPGGPGMYGPMPGYFGPAQTQVPSAPTAPSRP